MAPRLLTCPECSKTFRSALPADQSVSCPECGADVATAASSRTATSSRGGERRSNPRKPAAKPASNPMPMIAAAGAVLVIGAAIFFFMKGNEEKTPEADITSKTGPAVQTPAEDDPFAVKSNTMSNTPASGTTEVVQPQRVVGREPKSVKMDDLLDQKDRLYVTPDVRAAVNTLKSSVDEYLNNRWDVSKELVAEHKRLTTAVNQARTDSFLFSADAELNKYNDLLKSELRKKGKDGQFLPQAFVGFTHKPYVFFVQADIDGREEAIFQEVLDQLLQLRADFMQEFSKFIELKEDAKRKDELIKVMLLRTFEDYQIYNRARAPERDDTLVLAHYEPNARMLVVPLAYGGRVGSDDPDYERKAVMFHEGTHQLVHAFAPQSHLSAYGPMWCDEGLAEHFAGFVLGADGKYIFRRLNRMRCEALAGMSSDPERRMGLEEMLKWSRSIQGEEEKKNLRSAQWRTLQVYAQGWAMIDFLNNYGNGKYRPRFESMMRRLFKDGDTGLALFRRAFDNDDEFEKVRQEFSEYIDTLSAAQREKRIWDGKIHETPKSGN